MTKKTVPQTDSGLAKIGNSFANLFRRQHLQSLQIEALQTELSNLRDIVDDLMMQLEAAADEDTTEE